jgi:uncharacterized metal-binding protein
MPKGKTHDQIAYLSLIPTFFAGYYIFKDAGPAAILTLATLIGALFLSPDLDTKSKSYYRWGILKFIWIPYRHLIKHRSRWSHSLLAGPVLKTIYISTLLFLSFFIVINIFVLGDLTLFIHNIHQATRNIHTIPLQYIASAIAGIIWANTQHVITDLSVSQYKKAVRKL